MTKRIASRHLHPPVVYPCSFEKPGYFLVFPGPSSVKMLPDFVIFQSIRAIALRYGNSDYSSTYQGCFCAISGDLASITGGQTPNDRESSNNGPRRFFRHVPAFKQGLNWGD
jgi:hypothetical protein